MNFEQMSKEELVERLKLLEGARGAARGEGPEVQHQLLASLQRHEVELQHRNLRELQGSLEESRARYSELFDSAPLAPSSSLSRSTSSSFDICSKFIWSPPKPRAQNRREKLPRAIAESGGDAGQLPLWRTRDLGGPP